MEFRHIIYFIKLSECTSISQVANELFISQQALSKCIKNLETELNVRLFNRTNQGIHLTEDGRYLKHKFQHICALYDEAVKESYDHFQINKGKIEFGVSPGFFRSIPAKYLIDFEKNYPNFTLEQHENPDCDCEDYVRLDKQHFAFSTKPWYMNGLQYTPLHREPLFFIANKDHPLASRASIKLSELKSERFLFFNNRYNIHFRTYNICKKRGFTPSIVYKSSDVSQLVKLAAENAGILICVKHVYEESAHENLVCIPIDDEEMYWELVLIYQKYEYLSKNAKFFINHFIAEFRKPDFS